MDGLGGLRVGHGDPGSPISRDAFSFNRLQHLVELVKCNGWLRNRQGRPDRSGSLNSPGLDRRSAKRRASSTLASATDTSDRRPSHPSALGRSGIRPTWADQFLFRSDEREMRMDIAPHSANQRSPPFRSIKLASLEADRFVERRWRQVFERRRPRYRAQGGPP